MPPPAKLCSDYAPPAGAASKSSGEDDWHAKRYQVGPGIRAFWPRFEAGFGRFPSSPRIFSGHADVTEISTKRTMGQTRALIWKSKDSTAWRSHVGCAAARGQQYEERLLEMAPPTPIVPPAPCSPRLRRDRRRPGNPQMRGRVDSELYAWPCE